MRLYAVQIQPLIDNALREDLGGNGDVTTQAVVPAGKMGVANIVARERGCIAGAELAALVFRTLDPSIEVEVAVAEGAIVEAGTPLLRLRGSAATILTGERTALNFMGRMSGIASSTERAMQEVKDTRAQVVCTRKTTPGLRLLEKYAVRCGGGSSHRFGLDDGILIKDNHRELAGGVVPAVRAARAYAGHMLKIELEVDSLAELAQAIELETTHPEFGLDAVLLDNFSEAELREGVRMVAGRWSVEASGGITLPTLRGVAQSGVDLISMGSLTHSSRVMDLSLDVLTTVAV